jgi:hypothetical protein
MKCAYILAESERDHRQNLLGIDGLVEDDGHRRVHCYHGVVGIGANDLDTGRGEGELELAQGLVVERL